MVSSRARLCRQRVPTVRSDLGRLSPTVLCPVLHLVRPVHPVQLQPFYIVHHLVRLAVLDNFLPRLEELRALLVVPDRTHLNLNRRARSAGLERRVNEISIQVVVYLVRLVVMLPVLELPVQSVRLEHILQF